MPHLRLDYSSNVREEDQLEVLFGQLHDVLYEVGGVDRSNCKSRALKSEHYLVAGGNPGDAFVHLDVRFLEGRSPDLKRDIGERLIDTLRTWFSDSESSLALQITVEIHDIERASYFKFPTGTLSPH